MRPKTKKIICAVGLMIVCIMCITNRVFADNFDFTEFDNKGISSVDKAAQSVMGTAIQVIRIVGTAEKAEFKRSAAIYVVGAILIFGATQILAIVIGFADTIFASK